MKLLRLLKHLFNRCAEDGCWTKGDPCYLDPCSDTPYEWVCCQHAHEAGYCYMCGCFWAGAESFDFNPSGLCPNCQSEADENDYDREEDDYYYGQPPYA